MNKIESKRLQPKPAKAKAPAMPAGGSKLTRVAQPALKTKRPGTPVISSREQALLKEIKKLQDKVKKTK